MSQEDELKYIFGDDGIDALGLSRTKDTAASLQTQGSVLDDSVNTEISSSAAAADDAIFNEEEDTLKSLDLDTHNETVRICAGGLPGIGNAASAGSRHRRRSMPNNNMLGQPGQQRSILLELKLIADVGLVGFPNACAVNT